MKAHESIINWCLLDFWNAGMFHRNEMTWYDTTWGSVLTFAAGQAASSPPFSRMPDAIIYPYERKKWQKGSEMVREPARARKDKTKSTQYPSVPSTQFCEQKTLQMLTNTVPREAVILKLVACCAQGLAVSSATGYKSDDLRQRKIGDHHSDHSQVQIVTICLNNHRPFQMSQSLTRHSSW